MPKEEARTDVALSGRGRRITACVVLACTIGATVAIVISLKQPLSGIDDANIFFAYARNLAAGQGLVYYPGGERVEGFSSPAWMVICSAATLLSSRFEIILLVVNVLLVTLTLAGVLSFVRRDIWPDDAVEATSRPTVWFEAAVICWVLFSPSYAYWCIISLMESALWGLVLTFGTIAAARGVRRGTPGWAVAAWVAAALATRPEGMMIALVWIAARFVGSGYLDGWKAALRGSIVPLAAYAIAVTGLISFRFMYFGYPLPNTYYAKVSPHFFYNLAMGLKYFTAFAMKQMLVLLCLTVGLVLVLEFLTHFIGSGRRRDNVEESNVDEWHARLFVFIMALLAACAAPILAGGDHFPMARFYQPLWPMFAVPLLAWTASCRNRRRPTLETNAHGPLAWKAVGVALLLTLYAATTPRWDQMFQRDLGYWHQARNEFTIAETGRHVGDALNEILRDQPSASVGVIAAGGVAMTYRGPIVDLMGLNNVRMGHSPGDRIGMKNHSAFNADVFFELAPDIVLPRLIADAGAVAKESQLQFENGVLHGLFESPKFKKQYVGVFFPRPADSDAGGILCWCRSEVLARLRAGGVTARLFTPE